MTPLLAPRSPASWRSLTSAHRQAVFAARAQALHPVFTAARTRRAEAEARVMRREGRSRSRAFGRSATREPAPTEGVCYCGSKDARFAPDPYASEIHGDETPVWMCNECRHESAMDI